MKFPKRNIVKVVDLSTLQKTLKNWIHIRFNQFLFKTLIAPTSTPYAINGGRITRVVLRDTSNGNKRIVYYDTFGGWTQRPNAKLAPIVNHLIKYVENHIEGISNDKNQLELFHKRKRLKIKQKQS